jgi:hypothetical protein
MAMPMSPVPEDDEEKRLMKTLDKSCAGCERTRTGKMFTSELAGVHCRQFPGLYLDRFPGREQECEFGRNRLSRLVNYLEQFIHLPAAG